MPGVTTEAINERVRDYFREALSKSLDLAFELPLDPACDLGAEVELLSQDVVRMRSQLAQHSFSDSVRSDAKALLDAVSGPSHIDLETFQYACNVVLRARVENIRHIYSASRQPQLRSSLNVKNRSE
jgi:hypothetical protein